MRKGRKERVLEICTMNSRESTSSRNLPLLRKKVSQILRFSGVRTPYYTSKLRFLNIERKNLRNTTRIT